MVDVDPPYMASMPPRPLPRKDRFVAECLRSLGADVPDGEMEAVNLLIALVRLDALDPDKSPGAQALIDQGALEMWKVLRKGLLK